MTAIDYEGAFDEPPFLARALHLGTRPGALLGLAFWLAAWAALGLHVAHAAGLGGGVVFATVEAWLLIGAGLGLPAMALHILGARLTPGVCAAAGAALSACAALLTVLYASGALHPTPIDSAYGLLLCGGMALRCFNAGDTLRAMRTARLEHHTDCVMAETMAQHELAEALAPLTVDERAQLLGILTIATQRCSAGAALHAVNGAGTRSA